MVRFLSLLQGIIYESFLFYSVLLFHSIYSSSAHVRRRKSQSLSGGNSRENLDRCLRADRYVLEHQITDWDVQVHTGDFTHHGTEADWQRTLAVPGIRELYVPGKFLLCTSDHYASGDKGDPAAFRGAYDRHTRGVLPINDADSTTHFYAWHRGNVHIVFLDAYFSDSTTIQRWLIIP